MNDPEDMFSFPNREHWYNDPLNIALAVSFLFAAASIFVLTLILIH